MPAAPGLYSRLVAILKVGLPLLALALLSGLFLVRTEDEFGGEIVFSEGDIAALGDGLSISNSVFFGTTADNDEFRFSAELVVPDAAPPTNASIEKLSGQINFADGRDLSIIADQAELDIPAQTINLFGSVSVTSSGGMSLQSEQMHVDLLDGSLTGSNDVVTTGSFGIIRSGSLLIGAAEDIEDPRSYVFGDGVSLIYNPAEQE